MKLGYVSRVGLAYKKLLLFIQHASLEQRKILIKAKIESLALYGGALIFNESESLKKRFLNIIMKINKWVLKENCFRKKNKEVCEKIKVDEPDQIFKKTNIIYICKIMRDKACDQILNKLIINKRAGSKIYIKAPHKPSSKSSLVRHIDLFNALPFELKTAKITSIKRRLKKEKVIFS